MNGEGEIPKYLGCIPRNLTPWPPLHEWRGGNAEVLGLHSAQPHPLAPSPSMARGKLGSRWVAFRATSPPGPLSMNGEGEIPKYLGCIPRNLTPWPPLHEWRGGNSEVLGLHSAQPHPLAPSP